MKFLGRGKKQKVIVGGMGEQYSVLGTQYSENATHKGEALDPVP
jgi:hypothetical protein